MKSDSYRPKEEKIFPSMSRKASTHNKAVMENFFGLLKQEIDCDAVYDSYEEWKVAIE